MRLHKDLRASPEFDARAKALGVDVEVNIFLEKRPAPEEEKKLEAAITAAHLAILVSLEAAGFKP